MSSPTSVVLWPNGQTLTSSALTPDSIATIFQNLTLNILGITPSGPTDQAYNIVRIMWQQAGQPAMNANQDIVYIGARIEFNHTYGQQIRDRNYIAASPESITAQIVYTRVWVIRWSIYGPNCFDTARLIKDALISSDWAGALLSLSNLYLVPTESEPKYLPEEMPIKGQWWKRVEYEAIYNEEVDDTLTTPTVKTSEIKIYDSTGEIKDFTLVNTNG